MKEVERLALRLEATHVQRWHTVAHVAGQNVAEHSYGVAQIVRFLCPDASKQLICAALDHDIIEKRLGDLPYQTKSPTYHEQEQVMVEELGLTQILTPYEQDMLKAADLLDMGVHSVHQLMMGNRYFEEVLANVVEALEPYSKRNLGVEGLWSELKNELATLQS